MFNIKMIISFLMLMLSFIMIPKIHAASLTDPMRPPSFVMSGKSTKSNWNLSSTLVAGGRRLAMLNKNLVSIGDKVGNARVIAIGSGFVKLKVKDKIVVVNLDTESLRKSSHN